MTAAPAASPTTGAVGPASLYVAAPGDVDMNVRNLNVQTLSLCELTTVDEDIEFDWDDWRLLESRSSQNGVIEGDTYTDEMYDEGLADELERLERVGMYEILEGADRDPSGRMLTTGLVPKAKLKDGKKICRVRLVGKDFKFLDPHKEGLFAATTGHGTSRVVDFVA